MTCGPWLVASSAGAAEPPRNGIGVAITYLAPSSPLEPGVGAALQYRREVPRNWVLTADLGFTQIDREAEGMALEGSVSLTQLALGALWRFTDGSWSLAAGGGIDWLAPDGDGDYVSGPSTAVTNDYDVDAGLGVHAVFEASHAIGQSWRVFGRAGWLVAELDGTQRFVVDGVAGAPLDVTFDFAGPQLAIGAAWMF